MALIVKVFINQQEIILTYAQRIHGKPSEMCTYMTDKGAKIKHHYDDGAAKLAIKLLKKVTR